MKKSYLTKAVTLLSIFILCFSLFSFLPNNAFATSRFKWNEITPTNSNASFLNNSYYNNTPYSSFAELIETKPDEEKVLHWFLAYPAYRYSYGQGVIMHSKDRGATWNKINPSQWGTYDGGGQISLKTFDYPWTDSNGSSWNGKLFVYCNNSTRTYFSQYTYYWGYRPSVYRYDGSGANILWTRILEDTPPGYLTGQMYPYYWSYGFGNKTFMEEFNGQLYIVAYYFDHYSGSYSYYNISVFRYNGNMFSDSSDTSSWTETWRSPTTYRKYYYYGPPMAYSFKKHSYGGTNYLFLSTSSPTYNYADYIFSQYAYGGGLYRSTDGANFNSVTQPYGPPLCLESFKGYLYAGVGGGYGGNRQLYRVQNVSGSLSWEFCGNITDSGGSTVRQYYPVFALGKTRGKDSGGSIVDQKLYIGGYGFYAYTPSYRYTAPLFSTEGLNTYGLDSTPLMFTLEEDEWLNKYTYVYDIYDIFPSSMGLVVSTYTYAYEYYSTYNYRYQHIFSAPPYLDIIHEPKPVVVERGQYSQITFWLTPGGGFGPDNIKLELELPLNVFVPNKDEGGNVIVENLPFLSSSWPMNSSPLIFTPIIKSTLSAPLGTFDAKLIVTDLTLKITVEYLFKIQIVPPKPGFTSSVMPSYAQVFKGECQKFSVDITSRDDFNNNVIIDIIWLTAPPSDDITFKWDRSSFIYDYVSDTSVEVRTRKNMGTRYFFTVCTTDNTTLGTFKFRVIFFSGSIYKYTDVTFVVLRPPATFSITPTPTVAKVVPGGSAYYRVKIESKNGYVGFVNLSLQDIPLQTDVTDFKSENPLLGYPDNYIELTLSQPIAWAILEVKTYATYRDAGDNLIKGTPSGLHYIKVVGEGQGFDQEGNPVTPTAFGLAGLQVFQQIEDMKTPTFSGWGMILILFGIFGSLIFLLKKRDNSSSFPT